MSFIRRCTAVLSSVLLLQLALLGSGTLCAMHGDHGAGRQVHAMRGMTAAAAEGAMPNGPGTVENGGASDGGGDCQLPWAPGQCASMTSCTAPAAPPPVVAAQLAQSRTIAAIVESTRMGTRPAAAPELPPPRA